MEEPKEMIPDYLIYDEIKRRRTERERDQRVQLEVPLYRPRLPISEPPKDDEDEGHDDSVDRGVFIIDMNDLFDEEEDDEDVP